MLANGEVIDRAAGVLSTATGVEATTDSLFQIGSITKVWTTTLVMQLVDEGLLELDAPVRTYLPDFHIADESAAAAITVRMLLCHTAGFEGDIFTDTGRGDDCVEKYVATLHDLPQLFAPGERFSYNNAGFCVLGRIVEVLRGKAYDECLAEYLFAPLGLQHAAAGPYEAILHRAAVGHIRPEPDSDSGPRAGLVPDPVQRTGRRRARDEPARPADVRAYPSQRRHGAERDSGVERRRRQGDAGDPGAAAEARAMGEAWGLGWEVIRSTRRP